MIIIKTYMVLLNCTTLGWLLHRPDNLGLDKVDGIDQNIKIDDRGH